MATTSRPVNAARQPGPRPSRNAARRALRVRATATTSARSAETTSVALPSSVSNRPAELAPATSISHSWYVLSDPVRAKPSAMKIPSPALEE